MPFFRSRLNHAHILHNEEMPVHVLTEEQSCFPVSSPSLHVLPRCFLALLDFVSRATVVAQASVCLSIVSSLTQVSQNCCMDPGQILWKGSYMYPPPDHFLALLCATAQQSYCRHAGIRRPSIRTKIWASGVSIECI